MAIITFLTDFGLTDSYVAEMKAAALNIASRATVIDITHNIAPQDVAAASLVLGRAIDAFREGRFTSRSSIQASARIGKSSLFESRIRSCSVPTMPHHLGVEHASGCQGVCSEWRPEAQRGVTFDGRDRFAPVAAMLAKKRSLLSLAKSIAEPILLDLTPATSGDGRVCRSIIRATRSPTFPPSG